jgi:hypothetical protein
MVLAFCQVGRGERGGPTAVAVRASNLASRSLGLKPRQTATAARQLDDIGFLLDDVVELEHD